MRRLVTFGLAWAAAAGVALAVAWQGVSIVGDQVTESRPAPLSAAEIQASLEDGGGPTDDTTVQDGVPSGSTTTSPAPTSTTAATTAGPTSTASTTATQTNGATTPASDAAAETRTYTLTGGSASLRFEPSGVTVLWANPNAGFSVEIEPENVNGVKVEFESESHRSRVDGWWDGGPQDRVREDPSDD